MIVTGLRVVAAVIVVGLLSAAAADGKGIGGISEDTMARGIAAPDGGSHLYAVPDRGRTQLIRVTPSREDQSLRRLGLNGRYVIPSVAKDGTTSGLSRDGNTLVMAEWSIAYPRRETNMVVVDTERWEVFSRISLEGAFAFDAISPDGSVIYLIHYPKPRDASRYEVRAYDTVAGKLRPDPIIDERVAASVMRGSPITRATSPDGTWEYTLYDGGGRTPFVHALNTVEATTFCINVDQVENARNLYTASIDVAPDGAEFTVLTGPNQRPRAVIRTEDWSVSDPPASDPTAAADAGRSFPAGEVLAAVGLLVVGTGLGLRRRRRQKEVDGVEEMPDDPLPGVPGPEAEPAARAKGTGAPSEKPRVR